MMARSRNIKPGFFQNEDLQELDFATRLFFIGLWTEADREGRLEERPRRLKNALFPVDDVVIEDMLAGLARYDFIRRYERDGKRLIQIVKWANHQNPHKREAVSVLPGEFDETPADEEIGDAPGPNQAETEAMFESFWKCYPRKTAKDTARKAFAKLKPTADLLERMMAALGVQSVSPGWVKDGGQFIPHASTWLNQKRWDDEVRQAGNVHHLPSSRHNGFADRDYTAGLKMREDGTYAF